MCANGQLVLPDPSLKGGARTPLPDTKSRTSVPDHSPGPQSRTTVPDPSLKGRPPRTPGPQFGIASLAPFSMQNGRQFGAQNLYLKGAKTRPDRTSPPVRPVRRPPRKSGKPAFFEFKNARNDPLPVRHPIGRPYDPPQVVIDEVVQSAPCSGVRAPPGGRISRWTRAEVDSK